MDVWDGDSRRKVWHAQVVGQSAVVHIQHHANTVTLLELLAVGSTVGLGAERKGCAGC